MCVIFLYRRLDENVDGAGEEGDFVEQEDQGQGYFANQGKPSLDHVIVLQFFYALLYLANLHDYRYYRHSGIFGNRSIGKSQVLGKHSGRIPVHPYSAPNARQHLNHD